MYRLFTSPVPLDAPAGGGGQWGAVATRWGIGALLALHAFILLLPSWVTGWNSAPARLYLFEGIVLGVALWALVGILARLAAFTRDPGTVSPADALITVAVVAALVTGILAALTDRWATYWGAEVAAPYARSLLGGSPRPDLLGALPVLARAHVIAGFVALAAFPFSRWMTALAAPARAVHRFLRELVSPSSEEPAGARVGWGAAWVRALAIGAYFVVGVVVIPSQALERTASLPRVVGDLVAGGLSLGAVAVGLVVLRWAQSKARI
jgi:nitrate reductase gamma subunit